MVDFVCFFFNFVCFFFLGGGGGGIDVALTSFQQYRYFEAGDTNNYLKS